MPLGKNRAKLKDVMSIKIIAIIIYKDNYSDRYSSKNLKSDHPFLRILKL